MKNKQKKSWNNITSTQKPEVLNMWRCVPSPKSKLFFSGKEEFKIFLGKNIFNPTNKMDISQTVLAVLLVILGTLILCHSQLSPKRENAGGNFLEESDLDDESGFYIR